MEQPSDPGVQTASLAGVLGLASGTDPSDGLLQILLDSMTNAVFWKDLSSAYLGCNRVFARFAGVEPDVLIGMSDRDMPWADHSDFPADWFIDWDLWVIEKAKPQFGIVEQLRSASGEYRWLETNKVPLRNATGDVIGVLGTFEDITDRRRAEEELQRTLAELDDRVRQRTQELVQANQSLRREVEDRVRLQAEERQQRDYADALRDTAAAMARSFDVGEVADEVIVGVQRLVSNDLTGLVLIDEDGSLDLTRLRVGFGYHAAAPEDGALETLAVINELRDGSSSVVLDNPASAIGDAGSAIGVSLQMADQVIGYVFVESSTPGFFTAGHAERLGAVADQAGAAISNARLASRVAEIATAEERQRLAQELHDAVNQTLWTAALTAESLVAEAPDPSPVRDKAMKLGALTRGALAEMRSLLLELRPEELEAMPLHELIEHLLTALEARRLLDVDLRLEPVDLDPTSHIAFYRIAQEAIGNVAQHSEASRLEVRLLELPCPMLVVSDNGVGFDIGAVPAGHLGLRFMRDRAEAIGAKFAVETSPGHGTTIRVWR